MKNAFVFSIKQKLILPGIFLTILLQSQNSFAFDDQKIFISDENCGAIWCRESSNAPNLSIYPRLNHLKVSSPSDITIVNYAGDGSSNHEMFIARPPGNSTHPVVLHIHGGFWSFSHWVIRTTSVNHAANHGFVGVSINYSLTKYGKLDPDSPAWQYWPDQLNDAKLAVSWLKSHAENYGIDPDRIYVFGHSAGGHIVLMLALTNSDQQNPNYHYDSSGDIQGACSIAGGTDLFKLYLEPTALMLRQSFLNDLLDNPAVVVSDGCDTCSGIDSVCILGKCRENPDGKFSRASPIYNLPNDTSSLVPIMMVTGTQDIVSPILSQHIPFYFLLSPEKKQEIIYPCGHNFIDRWDDIDHKAYMFFSGF